MNEKQINKWLRKRFSPVGWTLVGYYVLMNILVSMAMLRDVIAGYLNAFIEGNDQYVPDVSALTGNAWGYIAAVAVALVILYAWKGREFWGGEVLRREKPMKPGTLLCMVFHGNLLQTPYAFLVGLVLGYVAVEYSVGWSMALHIFNNLVLADLLSRLTANLPEVAASVLELTIFTGFFAAAVAILIANRARVRAYIQSEWIDRRCLKCFFFSAGVIVLTVLMVINMMIALSA